MVDIDNPNNYKNCVEKQCDTYVCMPPKNTIVVNKFEQASVVKQLGNRTYFTEEDIRKLQVSNPSMIDTLKQLVSQGKACAVTDATPFVLSDNLGQMWTTSPDILAKYYYFLRDNQPYPINKQSLSQRLRKDGFLDWTVVRVSQKATQNKNMACFVPLSQKFQLQLCDGRVMSVNEPGISHGKGDFIFCTKLPNGKPNLGVRWVVNGEIFANSCNNQGWTDCISPLSAKTFTIDTLPKLVPQQTEIDKGVDPNTFKQKCDTIIKELQKVYKFEVKSNEYGTVDKCIGFSKSKCYTARYIVEGNFNYKYGSLDEPSSSTLIWFVCDATHSDSALGMVFERDEIANTQCKDVTKGILFIELPHNNTSVNTTHGYKNCRTGSISDINCVKEVQSFKQRFNGTADTLIDNRKNDSNTDIDVKDFLDNIRSSNVQGCIGIHHVLEEVYSRLNNDTLKERVNLCHKIYAGTNIGYGSASLKYASFIEAQPHSKGAMIGNGVLSRKMNLKSLIKYLVSVCQHDEKNSYYAKSILGNLSGTALAEAIMKLFYDTNNPNLSVLWKRLDLHYMLESSTKILIYLPKGYYDVNDKRVCIDFTLNSFEDGVFVRCSYTTEGNYSFDFIPKTPIQEYKVGTTFSFDKDYDNYIEICKQLRDSCYRALTEDASSTFKANLPKHLIKTDLEYLGLIGNIVAFYFKAISTNRDVHNSDYNREKNTYKIKFAVGNNDTRILYMSEDDSHTISVKCSLNGVNFEKSYKLSIKRNARINAMLIFSDICKVLKIHPAKELLKSKRLWDRVTQRVSEKFSSGVHRKFDLVDASSKIDKIVPVSIKLNDTNYEILMRFYNNEKVIGNRVLVVDFNYDNFDIRNTRSKCINALRDLENDNFTNMMFTMHYKYGVTDEKGTKHDTSFDEEDIRSSLYWVTWELINSNKKYQS